MKYRARKLNNAATLASIERLRNNISVYADRVPLDPYPWIHWCEDGELWCSDFDKRRAEQGINDVFYPRPGYEQDRSKYE